MKKMIFGCPDELFNAVQTEAQKYGISKSAVVKIALSEHFTGT